MSFLKEFKKFAVKGNALDLAVGVIIGAAFGKIVTSLVEDVIMPPLGLLIGRVDFTNFFFNLTGGDFATLDAAKKAGAVTINYGVFINAMVQFLIVAFAVFMLVRQINKLADMVAKEEKEEAKAAPPRQEVLLAEIRDLLKK